MAKEMPVLTEQEMKECVGGSGDGTIMRVSLFEVDCFYHFGTGSGSEMNLSESRFGDIVSSANELLKKDKSNLIATSKKTIDGKVYTSKTISFYDDDVYDYAIGTATIIYDDKGKAVGFQDDYDFNTAGAQRDDIAQFTTKLGKLIENISGAQSYKMSYGITF